MEQKKSVKYYPNDENDRFNFLLDLKKLKIKKSSLFIMNALVDHLRK